MPRFNVKHPDTGRWRCFSTVVDDWVSDWMDKEKYEEWRKFQYGIHNYSPAEQCNMMTLEEAQERISFRKEWEEQEGE